MFNKNVKSISNIINEGFKQQLLETPFSYAQSKVSAHKSQSNHYVIALNNVPLDAFDNPFEDAKNVCQKNLDSNLNETDIVFLFGFGFGYLPKRIFTETNSKIIIYEPHIEVLRFVFEYVDFSDILSSQRVFISTDLQVCLDNLSKMFFQKEKINFVFNNSYLYLYQEEIKQISQQIIDKISNKKSDVATIKTLSKKWVKNFLNNQQILKNTRPVNYLENVFKGKDAIILCAGPSLKENIELIKQNQSKFVVIALNKIADYVLDNGIIPDFIIVSDAYSFKNFLNFENPLYQKTNFILSAKCAKSCFDIGAKHFFIYYPSNSVFIENAVKNADESIIFDKTAGTTSIYAWECAKIFGCKNVIFAGLDLAFKGETRYSADVELKKDVIENSIQFTTVKNCKGQDVKTRNDYALFIKQFEETLKNNTDINIYNITSFGAKIEGMNYISLEQFFNKQEKTNISVDDDIDNVFVSSEEKWNELYLKINEYVTSVVQQAKEIKYNIMEKEIKNIKFPVKYYDFSADFLAYLKQLLNNSLLCDYFQYEIMEFLSKFETLSLENEDQCYEIQKTENAFIDEVTNFLSSL